MSEADKVEQQIAEAKKELKSLKSQMKRCGTLKYQQLEFRCKILEGKIKVLEQDLLNAHGRDIMRATRF